MNYVAGAGAAAFVFTTIFFLWFGTLHANIAAPQPIYPYSLHPTSAGAVADFWSLALSYAFVFASGLLGYGWLGVLAMAGEGAKYAGLLLGQKMAATEFFFALPQLAGLAGASLLCESAFAKGSERKRKLLLAGALSIGGFALMLVFYFVREALLK